MSYRVAAVFSVIGSLAVAMAAAPSGALADSVSGYMVSPGGSTGAQPLVSGTCPGGLYTSGPCNGFYNLSQEDGIAYQGGKVQSEPKTYIVFAGDWSNYSDEKNTLTTFYQNLATSNWANSFLNYNVSFDTDGGAATNSGITDLSNYTTDADYAYDTGSYFGVINWSRSQFIFIAAPGVTVPSIDLAANGGCSEHNWGSAGGQEVYYQIIPAVNFINGGCEYDYSLVNSSGEKVESIDGSLTAIASHEWAETATDPQGAGWLDPAVTWS